LTMNRKATCQYCSEEILLTTEQVLSLAKDRQGRCMYRHDCPEKGIIYIKIDVRR